MDLTIVIVTRNTCDVTCEAIRSVLASDDSLGKEILVVDNGSSDGTSELLQRQFPGVRCLRSESNLGFARAVNWAASQCQGELLLLLNSDARLQPESLQTAVAWMEAHPECGVAGAQLQHPDGRAQNSVANFPSLATELLNKSVLRRLFPRHFPGKEHKFDGPVEVESIVGAFFLTRRRLWDSLGGMDERFFFFLEETDFCLRVKGAGQKVFHLPQVTVWHGQGQSAKAAAAEARIEYWRSRYRYFEKNGGRFDCLVLRLGLLVRLWFDVAASGLMTIATLGRANRWRDQLAVHRALLAWHLRGCPDEMGLPR